MTTEVVHQFPVLPRKYTVVGVSISNTKYEDVLSICREWVAIRQTRHVVNGDRHNLPSRYICVTSVHGIMTARHDPFVRAILNAADIATPDGMPVVWALRSFGLHNQERVYGPSLMIRLCEQAAACQHRVFLYGGTDETLATLERKLKERCPGLRIVGKYAPPFRPLTIAEDLHVKKAISAADADLIFVGISTPKQEVWMWEHRFDFRGSVMVGVGAAFDFHAGKVSQAPPWMQRSGLEWFFRLTQEPKRLWKRYMLVTPLFLPLWALQRLHLLTFERNVGSDESGALNVWLSKSERSVLEEKALSSGLAVPEYLRSLFEIGPDMGPGRLAADSRVSKSS
jgi:N-acetylglucosaminyldiphosphoundecaprenol N-acetyl-beta-D-mannosaminyltransferase